MRAMLSQSGTPPAVRALGYLERIAGLEREIQGHRQTEARLRAALEREEGVAHQKDGLIAQLELLSRESDHRMLNDLQMIVSLLSLQSRRTANTEAASQLAAAAIRVSTIERVHRRLHGLDGKPTVAFKGYLEEFCADFALMLVSDETPERGIAVEAIEIDLPTATAAPLGFIVNELITNAVKYGKGQIVVKLEANPERGYALSVSNDGPALPDGFDPAASRGLGMRIVMSFVEKIGGELRIGRSYNDQGARFTVLFC